MRTLNQILIDSSSYLDRKAQIPVNSTELALRTNYADQSVWEAAGLAQFPEFHNIYTLYATSASIPLPSNFKELMAPVHLLSSNGTWDEYTEIKPLERFEKNSSDKYLYILGNPASGYTAVFNNLAINSTISIDYQRFPSGLLTLTDICELPDPMFVVDKVEEYVLQSRSDDRFPSKKADASLKLSNMIGRKMKTANNGTGQTRRIGIAKYSIGG